MTEWTWERAYEAEDKFYTIFDTFSTSRNATIKRFLKQLARELLLLQSSDWQFLISTWSARDYAELRFSRHFENFKQIASLIETGRHDRSAVNYVRDLEIQNSCFKNLDLAVFKT
jgi:1,4-alpha-glucan branching enzyme